MVARSTYHRICQRGFMGMCCFIRGHDTRTAVGGVSELATKSLEIVHHFGHRGIGPCVARTKLSRIARRVNKMLVGQGGHAVIHPRDTISMSREDFAGRHDIAVDFVACDIKLPVCGVLDAVDDHVGIRIYCAVFH